MVDIVELLRSTKPNVYNDPQTARERIDMRNMIELDERAATEIETLRSKLQASEKEVARLRNQSDPLSDAAISDYDELLEELGGRIAERDAALSRLDAASAELERLAGLAQEFGRVQLERDSAVSRLDAAKKYCEEVIGRDDPSDGWRRSAACTAANVLNELNGTVKHPDVETRDKPHEHFWRDVPGDPAYRICDVCLVYERLVEKT